MLRAIANAVGHGELREVLATIAVALDRHELRAAVPSIPAASTPRLRRPAT